MSWKPISQEGWSIGTCRMNMAINDDFFKGKIWFSDWQSENASWE